MNEPKRIYKNEASWHSFLRRQKPRLSGRTYGGYWSQAWPRLLTCVSWLCMGALVSTNLFAQKPAWEPAPGHITIPAWPHGAPAGQPSSNPEIDATTAKDGLIAGKPLVRLGNVSAPSLTLYSPRKNNSGAAVVVFPGGGYRILAIDLEGSEVCDWLNSTGVNCVLLKYRVPDTGPFPKSPAALQDAQRALGLVRLHAAEWHIDPHRVGVLGFSAGGHLAAAISTNYDHRLYSAIDKADELSCRPDFTVLVYPAYLAAPGETLLNPDIRVTAKTPPTFLVQTEDDPAAPVENSVAYYLALKNAKVSAEMHLFSTGGHGYGLRRTQLPVTNWPHDVETWLHGIKVLPAP